MVSYGCSASEINSKTKLLILGEPVNAKLINDNSGNGKIAPPLWEVELKDLRVIEGERKIDFSQGSFLMKAHNKEGLLNGGPVVLVIELSGDSKNVLYWENLIRLACIPRELLNSENEDSYFENPFGRPGKVCKFIR